MELRMIGSAKEIAELLGLLRAAYTEAGTHVGIAPNGYMPESKVTYRGGTGTILRQCSAVTPGKEE